MNTLAHPAAAPEHLPAATRHARATFTTSWGLPAALLATLIALWWLDPWSVKLLTKIFAIWIAVLGLQLLIGHAGILSLGHAAFVAIGAYSAGGLTLTGPHTLWTMLAAVLPVSAAAGALVGAAVLRTHGLYQLMATLAFAQMIYYGLQSLRGLGGDDGFALSQRPTLMGQWDQWSLSAARDSDYLLCSVVIVLAGVAAGLVLRLRRSELGARMQAVRDDAPRATSLGINVFAVKLIAFVVSAALAGTGGALLAHASGFASPQLGHWLFSGELMVLVLLGGKQSRSGALLACAALVVVQEIVARYTDHWPLALGALVLLRVLWPVSLPARKHGHG